MLVYQILNNSLTTSNYSNLTGMPYLSDPVIFSSLNLVEKNNSVFNSIFTLARIIPIPESKHSPRKDAQNSFPILQFIVFLFLLRYIGKKFKIFNFELLF